MTQLILFAKSDTFGGKGYYAADGTNQFEKSENLVDDIVFSILLEIVESLEFFKFEINLWT